MFVVALPVLVPLAGLALVVLLGRDDARARVLSVIATLATIAASVVLLLEWRGSDGILAWVAEGPSAVPVARLAADGLALPLVLLTALLGFVAVLASWTVTSRVRTHYALLLALQAAVTTVFLADDLVLFYVAWEAVLIPMFFLIGGWGHERRRHAAMKFFLYTFAGSALMLVGLLLIIFWGGGTTDLGAEVEALPTHVQTAVFWLLAAGMLVKLPVIGVHTWLPDAHTEAPTAGSVMLAGVLLKMGGYGLMRVAVPYAPQAFADAAWVLAVLGVGGIVYGAFLAFGQTDIKRLVAYSSVAHMGFVVLAIATGTALGYGAAMLGMVSHGLVAGLLFFLVGALYERTRTREMARLRGLVAAVPRWGGVFVFATLASLGLPGLSGFPGEFLTLAEAVSRWGGWIAVAGVGVVMAAVYGLAAVRGIGHGADAPEAGYRDLTGREWLAAAVLGLPIVALGVAPGLVLSATERAFSALAAIGGGF